MGMASWPAVARDNSSQNKVSESYGNFGNVRLLSAFQP